MSKKIVVESSWVRNESAVAQAKPRDGLAAGAVGVLLGYAVAKTRVVLAFLAGVLCGLLAVGAMDVLSRLGG